MPIRKVVVLVVGHRGSGKTTLVRTYTDKNRNARNRYSLEGDRDDFPNNISEPGLGLSDEARDDVYIKLLKRAETNAGTFKEDDFVVNWVSGDWGAELQRPAIQEYISQMKRRCTVIAVHVQAIVPLVTLLESEKLLEPEKLAGLDKTRDPEKIFEQLEVLLKPEKLSEFKRRVTLDKQLEPERLFARIQKRNNGARDRDVIESLGVFKANYAIRDPRNQRAIQILKEGLLRGNVLDFYVPEEFPLITTVAEDHSVITIFDVLQPVVMRRINDLEDRIMEIHRSEVRFYTANRPRSYSNSDSGSGSGSGSGSAAAILFSMPASPPKRRPASAMSMPTHAGRDDTFSPFTDVVKAPSLSPENSPLATDPYSDGLTESDGNDVTPLSTGPIVQNGRFLTPMDSIVDKIGPPSPDMTVEKERTLSRPSSSFLFVPLKDTSIQLTAGSGCTDPAAATAQYAREAGTPSPRDHLVKRRRLEAKIS